MNYAYVENVFRHKTWSLRDSLAPATTPPPPPVDVKRYTAHVEPRQRAMRGLLSQLTVLLIDKNP